MRHSERGNEDQPTAIPTAVVVAWARMPAATPSGVTVCGRHA
jgi:hypothetical protein